MTCIAPMRLCTLSKDLLCEYVCLRTWLRLWHCKTWRIDFCYGKIKGRLVIVNSYISVLLEAAGFWVLLKALRKIVCFACGRKHALKKKKSSTGFFREQKFIFSYKFGMSKITTWFSGIRATWSNCSKTDVTITVMHYNRATSGKRLLQNNIRLTEERTEVQPKHLGKGIDGTKHAHATVMSSTVFWTPPCRLFVSKIILTGWECGVLSYQPMLVSLLGR